MGVSKHRGTPKASILIGFSIINHPFWDTPIFGNILIHGKLVLWIPAIPFWKGLLLRGAPHPNSNPKPPGPEPPIYIIYHLSWWWKHPQKKTWMFNPRPSSSHHQIYHTIYRTTRWAPTSYIICKGYLTPLIGVVITPVTHVFSGMYRYKITPFIMIGCLGPPCKLSGRATHIANWEASCSTMLPGWFLFKVAVLRCQILNLPETERMSPENQ